MTVAPIAFAFHTAAQQRAASTIPPNNSGTVRGGTGTIGGSVSIASSGAILEGGTGSTNTYTGATTVNAGKV